MRRSAGGAVALVLALLGGVACSTGSDDDAVDRARSVDLASVDWEDHTYPPGTCGYPVAVALVDGRREAVGVEEGDEYEQTTTPWIDLADVATGDLLGDEADEVAVVLDCQGHEWSEPEVHVFGTGPDGGIELVAVLDSLSCTNRFASCHGRVGGDLAIRVRERGIDVELEVYGDSMAGFGWVSDADAHVVLGERGWEIAEATVVPGGTVPLDEDTNPHRDLWLGLVEGWDVTALASAEDIAVLQDLGVEVLERMSWSDPEDLGDGTEQVHLQLPYADPGVVEQAVRIVFERSPARVVSVELTDAVPTDVLHD